MELFLIRCKRLRTEDAETLTWLHFKKEDYWLISARLVRVQLVHGPDKPVLWKICNPSKSNEIVLEKMSILTVSAASWNCQEQIVEEAVPRKDQLVFVNLSCDSKTPNQWKKSHWPKKLKKLLIPLPAWLEQGALKKPQKTKALLIYKACLY